MVATRSYVTDSLKSLRIYDGYLDMLRQFVGTEENFWGWRRNGVLNQGQGSTWHYGDGGGIAAGGGRVVITRVKT